MTCVTFIIHHPTLKPEQLDQSNCPTRTTQLCNRCFNTVLLTESRCVASIYNLVSLLLSFSNGGDEANSAFLESELISRAGVVVRDRKFYHQQCISLCSSMSRSRSWGSKSYSLISKSWEQSFIIYDEINRVVALHADTETDKTLLDYASVGWFESCNWSAPQISIDWWRRSWYWEFHRLLSCCVLLRSLDRTRNSYHGWFSYWYVQKLPYPLE